MEAVVGQSSSGSGRWRLSRRTLVIVLAVVVVAAVVGGGVLWQQLAARHKQTAKVDQAIAQSQRAYDSGEYVNALNLVRFMADEATSDGQRARLYQAAAQAASSANKLRDAAHYYELRHQADPTTAAGDASILGALYERLGEKQKAIAQYKLALEDLKANKNPYGNGAASIQASLDALERAK